MNAFLPYIIARNKLPDKYARFFLAHGIQSSSAQNLLGLFSAGRLSEEFSENLDELARLRTSLRICAEKGKDYVSRIESLESEITRLEANNKALSRKSNQFAKQRDAVTAERDTAIEERDAASDQLKIYKPGFENLYRTTVWDSRSENDYLQAAQKISEAEISRDTRVSELIFDVPVTSDMTKENRRLAELFAKDPDKAKKIVDDIKREEEQFLKTRRKIIISA